METLELEPQKINDSLADYLDMYEISGSDAITAHSLERYLKDKEQDEAILQRGGNSSRSLANRIDRAFSAEKKDLIMFGLEQTNPACQVVAAEMIHFVPPREIAGLIKLALEHTNLEVQMIAASDINYAPINRRSELIMLALNHPNPDVQSAAAWKIKHVSVEDMSELIKFGLNHVNPDVQKAAAEVIDYAPKGERTALIKLGLKHPNPAIHKIASLIILTVPKEEQAELIALVSMNIKQGLESQNLAIKKEAPYLMESLVGENKKSMSEIVSADAKQGLHSSDPEERRVAAEMIKFASVNDRISLINLGLEQDDLETQKITVGMISYAPDDDIPRLIAKVLKSPVAEFQKIAAEIIEYAYPTDVAPLIKLCLEHENIEVRKIAASLLGYVPRRESPALFDLVIKRGLGEELIKPPLYRGNDMDKEHFSRKKFAKTGSGTTLVGGDLKDKVIVRHIEPEAFLAWQKIFEDHEVWRKAGFDYVPIEPIVSYRLNKTGMVDVFSGVLDLSLHEWGRKSDKFREELETQKYNIKKVLEDLHIAHGHTHDGNFCLRFFRDENGKVDFNRAPRVYLIDFDMAVSPK